MGTWLVSFIYRTPSRKKAPVMAFTDPIYKVWFLIEEHPSVIHTSHVPLVCVPCEPCGSAENKIQITTFGENGKIQLTPKITNHLFTCYINCMCKSNPVCLIQKWSVIILLGSYVQWLYFLGWHTKIDPLTFSHLCSLWKRYAVECFTSSMNE